MYIKSPLDAQFIKKHATANDYQQVFNYQFSNLLKLLKNSNNYTAVKNVLLNNYTYIHRLFNAYSDYLVLNKSPKAEKYFEYCLKLRPLNGYNHYKYSLFLYKILKDYKKALYHLKLAHKLNPQLYQLTEDNFHDWYLKLLQLKLKDSHLCNYINCILNKKKDNNHNGNSNIKYFVCKGCKSLYYCNKKCQRLDWTLNHKYQCISKYLNPLTKDDEIMVQQMIFMLKQWITNS